MEVRKEGMYREAIIKENNGVLDVEIMVDLWHLFMKSIYSEDILLSNIGNHEGFWEFEFVTIAEKHSLNRKGQVEQFIEMAQAFVYYDPQFEVVVLDHEAFIQI